MELIINNAFPKGMLGASYLTSLLNSIKANAPENPKPMPKYLISVIFSLIKNADIKNTKIGEIVIIIELLIGVERLNPLKNMSILMTIPKIAHKKIRFQSLKAMRSFGPHKLISQNKIEAPTTLKKMNPKGLI